MNHIFYIMIKNSVLLVNKLQKTWWWKNWKHTFMYVFCVVYICKPHKVTRMFAYRSINFLFACFISLATKYLLLLVFLFIEQYLMQWEVKCLIYFDFHLDFSRRCVLISSIFTKIFNSICWIIKLFFSFFWLCYVTSFCRHLLLMSFSSGAANEAMTTGESKQTTNQKFKYWNGTDSQKWISQFPMPMKWLEHFCDDRRDQVLTSIRI